MHVDITPRRFDLVPGQTQSVMVTLGNTESVIAGYSIRVLGADPSWVEIDDGQVSLFPEETRVVEVRITVPRGMTAGDRHVSVQVRELTPPEENVVEGVVFTVPEQASATARVDPVAAQAGRTARLSLLVDNTGNTPLSGTLHGQDPEDRVRFRFEPETVDIPPGEHALVDVRATARQRFLGSPMIRPLELRLVDPAVLAAPAAEPDPEGKLRVRRKPAPVRLDEEPPLANATFVQRAMVSRGSISLFGLLAAVTVFAIVITLALNQIVGDSAEDRDLALRVAAARDAAAASTGSTGVGGTITQLSTAKPLEGITASVYSADDTSTPVASTASGPDGAWSAPGLPPGDYKVSFSGPGFVQVWYPSALDAADAEAVTVSEGVVPVEVALGGLPSTISGRVVGDDVSAATLTLRTSGGAVATLDGAGDSAGLGAVVTSVPVGSDGLFSLPDVPSPSVYELVVEKEGYATSTQTIDVAAGEDRSNVEINLRKGDGVITGTVRDTAGDAIEQATVVAVAGQTQVTTTSLTGADAGRFTLRGLPTPASYSLTVSEPDHASETVAVTLADAQSLDGVDVVLSESSGTLGGRAEQAGTGAAGVLVTITDGTFTTQTATNGSPFAVGGSESATAGTWQVTGLPIPGNYTVTFSRPDLQSQTLSVPLDAAGNVSGGSAPAAESVSAAMVSATATVAGLVRQETTDETDRCIAGQEGDKEVAASEVDVRLSAGNRTYTVTTASVPEKVKGEFEVRGLPPGTYTLSVSRQGISPVSTNLVLSAGQTYDRYRAVLPLPACIAGTVKAGDPGTPVAPGWVVELYKAGDYPDSVYQTTTTNGAGGYKFLTIDAPQTYVVQVRRTRGSEPLGAKRVSIDRSERNGAVDVKAATDD